MTLEQAIKVIGDALATHFKGSLKECDMIRVAYSTVELALRAIGPETKEEVVSQAV